MTIFVLSFLLALTGAIMPGPLLTYTIIQSAGPNPRGYLTGFWVITGHAILESVIIIALLSGFSHVLKNINVLRVIGVTGGAILVYLGFCIVRDVYLDKIPTDFMDTEPGAVDRRKTFGLDNRIIGGITVSMSNPYWWVWWATAGFASMLRFDVSFDSWPNLLAFFLGHEAGDLIWYMLISTLSFFGLKRLNKRGYYGVLVFCGIFMAVFGIFLGVSPLLKENLF
ncbi:MAG: LysE family transporter [bacterium]|nr:LysE family transporter [bacterium]